MYAGRGVLAVVCPGGGTALPATGRKWHRTSLSRARRNLAWPARPGQGGARAFGRVQKATTAKPGRTYRDSWARRSISLGLQVLATKPAGTMDNLRSARFPDSLHRVGRKRQALSTPSPGEPSLKPACRYLSLRFQTIQSCSPVRYPITTAVQPWRAQECAYTFCNLTKPAARRIAGLRCWLYSRTAALLGHHCFRSLRFCEIPSFLHRIRIFAGPMKTPLCKISF